ncbi:MAG: DMT family transporter [Bacteroidales bacterium]
MNRQDTTGYSYALGASVALAASFVFSKSILNQWSMVHFGMIWFGLGVLWNLIWFLVHKEYLSLRVDLRKKTRVALGIALLEAAATGLFYLAIQAMENPAVVSFIGNMGPVFVTLLAAIFLKERFRGIQQAGIVIAIGGVFVINHRQGSFGGFLEPGSQYVLAASLLFALATIAGRWKKQDLVPGYMSLIRSFALALAMFILSIGKGPFPSLTLVLLRDVALGSLLETLLVIVLAYQALKFIEATRTSLIISTKGVWTLLLAWGILGVFPTGMQLTGGLLTLLGVWLITWKPNFSPPGRKNIS